MGKWWFPYRFQMFLDGEAHAQEWRTAAGKPGVSVAHPYASELRSRDVVTPSMVMDTDSGAGTSAGFGVDDLERHVCGRDEGGHRLLAMDDGRHHALSRVRHDH
jgi:hypothetical protein